MKTKKPVREKTLLVDWIEVVPVKAFFDIKNNDWIDYPYSSFVFDYQVDPELIKQWKDINLHYKINFVWVPVSNLLKHLAEHWEELLNKAHACKTWVEVACFIMEQFGMATAELHSQKIPWMKCMITWHKDKE